MSSRSYPRLQIETFGRALLESEDLDPVYVALRATEMGEEQCYRWLVAYWCLYHPGAACWLSAVEGKEFWRYLTEAAHNETACPAGGRWPRAPERRHWRGHNAVRCVEQMKT